MGIYVIMILLIILLYPALKRLTTNYKRIYCIICSIFLILIIGLRNVSMGQGDTEKVYKVIFDYFTKFSWKETFEYISKQDIEYGFYFLMKLFTMFSRDFHLFLFIISIPYIVTISSLIYKYSKAPVLSYMLFISLNYFSISFTLLRHVLAIAFLIIAFLALIKNRKLKFVLFVMLATLFHKTAIIFIITPIFYKIKFNSKQIFVLFMTLIILYFFGNNILDIVFSILGNGRYAHYRDVAGDNIGFFAINLLLLIFSLLYKKKYAADNSDECKALLNFQFLTVCMAAFIPFIGEAFRISTYFGIFSIILIPNCLANENNSKIKTIFYLLIIIFTSIYFILFTVNNTGINPYHFA